MSIARADVLAASSVEVNEFRRKWDVKVPHLASVSWWCDIMGWNPATYHSVYSILNSSHASSSRHSVLSASIVPLVQSFKAKIELFPEFHDTGDSGIAYQSLEEIASQAPFHYGLMKALAAEYAPSEQDPTKNRKVRPSESDRLRLRLASLRSERRLSSSSEKTSQEHQTEVLMNLLQNITSRADVQGKSISRADVKELLRRVIESMDQDTSLSSSLGSGHAIRSDLRHNPESYVFFPENSPLRIFIGKCRTELQIWTLANLRAYFVEYMQYYAKESAQHVEWDAFASKRDEVLFVFAQLVETVNSFRRTLGLVKFTPAEIDDETRSLERACRRTLLDMSGLTPATATFGAPAVVESSQANPVTAAASMAAVEEETPGETLDASNAATMSAPHPVSMSVGMPVAHAPKYIKSVDAPSSKTDLLSSVLLFTGAVLGVIALAALVAATHGAALALLALLGAKLSFGLVGGGTMAAEVIGGTAVGTSAATTTGFLGWLVGKVVKTAREVKQPVVAPSASVSINDSSTDVLMQRHLAVTAGSLTIPAALDRATDRVAGVAQVATKQASQSLSHLRGRTPGCWEGFLKLLGCHSMLSRRHSAVDLLQQNQPHPRRPSVLGGL